jgi:hypothetical protein
MYCNFAFNIYLTRLFSEGINIPYFTTSFSTVIKDEYGINRPIPAPVSKAFWLIASTQSRGFPNDSVEI